MKIAFILKYFLPEKTAGTEVYAAALCKELMNLDIDVCIIKPGFGLADYREYFYENIRVLEYPENAWVDKKLQLGRRRPEGLDFFKKLIITEKPDVVHFHEVTGSNGITVEHLKIIEKLSIPIFMTLHLVGYACQTGMLKFKDKTYCNGIIETYKCSVCTLHKKGFRFGTAEALSLIGEKIRHHNINTNALPVKLSGALSYPLYTEAHLNILKYIFSVSEKVFVLSEWFNQLLLINNFPANKLVVLPKALTGNADFSNKNLHIHKTFRVIKLVYIGRISRIKGLHTLLEALKSLQNKNWSLDIYGQVSEQDYYEECIKIVSKIKGVILWKGVINPTNVVPTLEQYDALVFPTIIQEMVGLVVQEAFAARVPVIGSNANGISEQVTDRVDGLLFKAGDPTSLLGVLNEVTSNVSLLSQIAANIKTPHLFKDVAEEVLKVYINILEVKNSLADSS